mmetsp:Transcript_13511/g.9733  ORF Transcript_13511/g.9733 Transcript_13511/m.9733 type:complete len:89 (+) Transcript_13511:660-926(+)|eukprot:CAMPEP_0202966202 /NCGR_PEP_ID=MMETSP1396-20130829/10513_1 /ASSEMBLY_ACC=CAM_ASM_000872 /TAXON_ID= /ORGANISM="Pseudokeronopsis sp., Strain Brazil" /LENGTH=88 /DNA_ID=CAMNT_0049689779 /DNA_START=604 /DNA_END=870 /DNA_ORIENTATION=+
MLARERMEREYERLFSEYGYGTTIWSPLAGGILSGKYNDGKIPEDSRFKKHSVDSVWDRFMGPTVRRSTISRLKKLSKVANRFEVTQA